MKSIFLRMVAIAGLMTAASSALAQQSFSELFGGPPALKGKKLKKAVEAASAHPLGSEANPIRSTMPQGQRAYLARLRCADGKPPSFERGGSLGPGIYGNIVDAYRVTCAGSEPAESTIIMDMYHNHEESVAVRGFTIVLIP